MTIADGALVRGACARMGRVEERGVRRSRSKKRGADATLHAHTHTQQAPAPVRRPVQKLGGQSEAGVGERRVERAVGLVDLFLDFEFVEFEFFEFVLAALMCGFERVVF